MCPLRLPTLQTATVSLRDNAPIHSPSASLGERLLGSITPRRNIMRRVWSRRSSYSAMVETSTEHGSAKRERMPMAYLRVQVADRSSSVSTTKAIATCARQGYSGIVRL